MKNKNGHLEGRLPVSACLLSLRVENCKFIMFTPDWVYYIPSSQPTFHNAGDCPFKKHEMYSTDQRSGSRLTDLRLQSRIVIQWSQCPCVIVLETNVHYRHRLSRLHHRSSGQRHTEVKSQWQPKFVLPCAGVHRFMILNFPIPPHGYTPTSAPRRAEV
jgi:hypothetical protein